MMRRTKVQLAAVFGIAVACYAWHVETSLVDPFYEPACSGVFGGNCGTVFKSEYAHVLSACGETYLKSDGKDYDWKDMGLCLLPKRTRRPKEKDPQAFCFEDDKLDTCFKFSNDHPLDLSLAIQGIVLYSAYFLAISIKKPFPFREQLFLGVAIAGACFSVYLLYVIKVILKEFCIVCFSFHMTNFCMLLLAVLEYRNPEVPEKKLAKD